MVLFDRFCKQRKNLFSPKNIVKCIGLLKRFNIPVVYLVLGVQFLEMTYCPRW